MKKLFVAAICLASFANISLAQSGKYVPAMKKALVEMDSAKTMDQLQNVSNSFERIATAEKDQWLPYYYAAYAQLMKNYIDKDVEHIDPAMDKADALLMNAEALSADNSEISTLKAMNAQRRMQVDPQSRYMTMGVKSGQLIKMAEKQDTANPRVFMFEAQTAFYTPTAFGGSKEKAIDLIKKSIVLFNAAKPKDELAPNWGKGYAENVLAEWSK
jgi:hypothetical protein